MSTCASGGVDDAVAVVVEHGAVAVIRQRDALAVTLRDEAAPVVLREAPVALGVDDDDAAALPLPLQIVRAQRRVVLLTHAHDGHAVPLAQTRPVGHGVAREVGGCVSRDVGFWFWRRGGGRQGVGQGGEFVGAGPEAEFEDGFGRALK